MTDFKGVCVLCGTQAAMMCQRCYENYCTVNCQIADWPKHKLICIPMPSLIPLQPIKVKKTSVNARLDRSNFSKDINEINPLIPIPRHDENISPLRRPYINSADKNSDHGNISNQGFKKFDRSPQYGNNQNSNNRGQGGTPNRNFHGNPDKDNQWEGRSVIIEKQTSLEENINLSKVDLTKPPPSHFQNKEIDFTLKLKNKHNDDVAIPKSSSSNTNGNGKSDDVISVSSKTSSKTPWKVPFPLPENSFFPVIVQYITEASPTIVWVTDASHDEACNKFLKEINKNISNKTEKCSYREINVGEVVAAPFENLYYRAIILEEKSPLNEVRVRLVDYGNDFYIYADKLKPAIPLMRNLKSFAFCIRYKGRQIEIGENLTIRIIGKENNEIYMIEEKSQPVTDAVPSKITNLEQAIPKEQKVSLIRIFGKKKAIVILDDPIIAAQLRKNNAILTDDIDNFSTYPKEGTLIVGRTENSWQRGYLLAFSKSKYIVYCSDIGQIEVVDKIKMIPLEYKNITSQAFVLEINKSYIDEDNLYQKYFIAGISLSLKRNSQDLPLIYDLYCGYDKLAEVITSPWSGCFSELDLEYWTCPPGLGDSVKITYVSSHCELYICVDNKYNFYSSLFDEIGKTSKTTDATVNKIILAPYNNQYVRCKITDKSDEEISVIDMDSGRTFKISSDQAKEADNFVKYSPVFTTKVALLYLNKITPCPSNSALSLLESYIKEEKKFIVTYEKCENSVELFTDEEMKSSLNKQLIPFLFEQNRKSSDFVNHTTNQKEVINDVSKEFIQIDDIETIPIPSGENVKILVLDDNVLSGGSITACVFNMELLQKQQEYTEAITKYCTNTTLLQEYSPRVNELCLSIFNQDGQWYRAVCLETMKDDEFFLLYVDYGNTTIAKKTTLRKISKEFLYPSLANNCIIDGLPQSVSEELLNKIKKIIRVDSVLIVDRVEKVDDCYFLLNIAEVKKLLP